MQRTSFQSVLFLLAGLLAAGAVQALDVFVRSPRDGQVVFGRVAVELEVLSAAQVAEVEIRLDGEVAARLTAPPFHAVVDVGEENRAHTFEITATDTAGETATRTVVTGRLEVDFELDLSLQQLYVTVERGGERVLGLDAGAFTVLDDSEAQELVTFEGGDVPLTAVLLVDSSASMAGEALAAALAAVRAFVAAMRELDEAKVIVFSDRVLAATPFTGDPEVVRAILDGVEASGDTAIHDHLYLALKTLEARQGRQVVVLLSDGIDLESLLDMEDVAWKAGRLQSLIYWIRLPSGLEPERGFFTIWRDADEHRRQVAALEETVAASGGRILEIAGAAEAAEAFREILRELREQYVLGYYPSVDRDDGAWRKVRVRVDESGVRVRARDGYFDDML